MIGVTAIYSAEIVFWFILLVGEVAHAIFAILVSPKRAKVYVKIIHHRNGMEEEIPLEFEKLKDSGLSSIGDVDGLHKRKNSENNQDSKSVDQI